MKHSLLKKAALISALVYPAAAFSTVIAIIDSGVDYQHTELKENMWRNSFEKALDKIDNDDNGYVDDIYGWNFADKNGEVIDYKYQSLFTADVERFFNIQTDLELKRASKQDKAWAKQAVKDPEFVKALETFGTYSHGTFVSHIALRRSQGSEIMAIKLLATESEPSQKKDHTGREVTDKVNFFISKLFKAAIRQIAKAQSGTYEKIAEYVNEQKVDVANGSFGVSEESLKPVVRDLLVSILGGKLPSDRVLQKYTDYLFEKMTEETSEALSEAPNTLFVFAAGNDGTNNSDTAINPGNVRLDNTLTVGAIDANGKKASFSNYSKTLVDVFAPGVAINAAVPGNHSLSMSGTSAAAPYVAGVAAEIKTINPDLTPAQIKDIIMSTSDKLASLKDYAVSSGAVNEARAQYAARLSVDMKLGKAIASANREIENEFNDRSSLMLFNMDEQESNFTNEDQRFILPLPNLR